MNQFLNSLLRILSLILYLFSQHKPNLLAHPLVNQKKRYIVNLHIILKVMKINQ
jgi:hypothetical protein